MVINKYWDGMEYGMRTRGWNEDPCDGMRTHVTSWMEWSMACVDLSVDLSVVTCSSKI